MRRALLVLAALASPAGAQVIGPPGTLAPSKVEAIAFPNFSPSINTFRAFHTSQIRRTSLWAAMRLMDEISKKVSTPMLIKRSTVEGASLVCKVLRTK